MKLWKGVMERRNVKAIALDFALTAGVGLVGCDASSGKGDESITEKNLSQEARGKMNLFLGQLCPNGLGGIIVYDRQHVPTSADNITKEIQQQNNNGEITVIKIYCKSRSETPEK